MPPSSFTSSSLRPDARWRSPVHAGAVAARNVIELAGGTPVRCPRCEVCDNAVSVHDHLRRDHAAGHADVLIWLDGTDPDLFALAIHHLAELDRKLAARR